ncbi:MAG: hypothetical protein NZZ41_06010, partial [Candidatus Dojkabacteria bacterium]|nr:hypothetical protein [Candidatus Dojkabacteria bacterium]
MSILGILPNYINSSSSSSSTSLNPLNLLDKIKTVDGHNSGLDADLLDGYHASHFATQTDITNLNQKINNLFPILSRVVFYEEFIGDGSLTTFTLNGTIKNAQFSSGSWNKSNIILLKQVHITDENYKPIYNSNIPLLKQRIFVTNIDSNGNVFLNYAPLNGQKFLIW